MRDQQPFRLTLVISLIVFTAIAVILSSLMSVQQLAPNIHLEQSVSWGRGESLIGLRTLPIGMLTYGQVLSQEVELGQDAVQQNVDSRLWLSPDKADLLLRHLYPFPNVQ